MSVINTNLNALVSQESSRSSNLKLSRSMERLSTGLRINSAKDDAAGLSISNRMTAQVRGIQMAIKNSNDAISMSQTAEGAYGQVGNILQRMRELAVQSATATMNASDRSSLQLEVDQLVEEINHIADTTNFNNIKLLNGTAKDLVIQTGANQEDKIKMSFDSVRANHIGSDIQPSMTSLSGSVGERGALADGDLMINGIQIGASYDDDDELSHSSKSASAIAKAVAINRLSDSTGVIAKVAENVVSGTEMSSSSSVNGTITINGYATATVTTTTDTALNRKLATDAINAITGATGVSAFDTQSDKGGIVLTAKDGRNIVVTLGNTLTGATTGVAATGTYVGKFDLFSKDGSPITLNSAEDTLTTSQTAGISKAGLRIGTFEGRSASTVTSARATVQEGSGGSATNTVADVAGVLNGDTLVINGIAIGTAIATDDTFSYQYSSTTTTGSQRSASAIAIAAAINKQADRTGVKATAEANVIRGTSFSQGTATSTAATVYLNGITINVDDTRDIDNVVDSFNEKSGQTGVVASRYGTALELRASDGRNITIGASDASVANLGLGSVGIGTAGSTSVVTFYSSVKLESDEAFTVESGFEGITNFERLGFRRGTFGGAVGDKVSEINITTQQGASDALRALDAAINQVSAAQALSGALNNRLDVIVNNLSEGLQNMSASRSRILDTDYATETTELAKQQIIQQAATAMLAQANQQPQGVLALLR
jgi:flagellin